MATVYKKRNPLRHPAVLWSRVKWRWPFITWFLALLLTTYLVSISGSFQFMQGTVNADVGRVAPLESAMLARIHVVPGQRVLAGAVLAEMDTELLDAEMQVEQLQTQRRFSGMIHELRSDLRRVRLDMIESQAELEVLDAEIKRTAPLLEQGLIDAASVAGLKARHLARSRAMELYPVALEELQNDLKAAEQLHADANQRIGLAATDGHSTSVSLQRLRREAYTLRAQHNAVISQISADPGEVMQAGETIMSLVYDSTPTITGYLPESNARELSVGQTVYITRAAKLSVPTEAKVTYLGPEVTGLPGRVSPIPGRTLRGRRVVLEPLDATELLPGETVGIHLRPPLWGSLIKRFQGPGA